VRRLLPVRRLLLPRGLLRLGRLLDRVARQERIDPLPLRVDIGRPAHHLQVSDIRRALELRPALVKVVHHKDFGPPLLLDNFVPAALQDKAVPVVLRAPVDRHRASRSGRAVVVEDVLGKVQ
jgi:hypothetical protein